MAKLYILGVLLLISTAHCQHYNSDYHVTDDVDDDGHHSSYKEEDDRPDYSKYYQKDISAPLVASPVLSGQGEHKESDSGFVSPLDFSGFISASHFGLGAESNPSSQKSLPVVPVLNPFHTQQSAATKESTTGFVDPKNYHVGFSTPEYLHFSPANLAAEAEKIGHLFAQNSFTPEKSQDYSSSSGAVPETNKKFTKSKYGTEAEDLEKHTPAEHESYKSEPAKSEDYESKSGYKKPEFDYSGIKSSYQSKITDLPSYTSPSKTSQVSSAKNYAPQYYPEAKYSEVKVENKPVLTPFQKYSFQPVATTKLAPITTGLNLGLDAGFGAALNLGNLNIEGYKPASLENFNVGNLKVPQFEALKNSKTSFTSSFPYVVPSAATSYYPLPSQYTKQEVAQPTEHKSEKAQGAECQRLEKHVSPEDISHGRFRRDADAMDCFVCKDPKTGGSYEKCSYTSDPNNDQSYFRGHAEKYSTKTYSNPEHAYRERRATKDNRDKRQKNEQEEKESKYENPYDFDKEYSHKFSSKPEEFDKDSYYKAPDFSGYEKSANYDYSAGYFTTPDKSFSELKSEELKKDPGNCKEVEKDSMTCTVCSNPKTGGSYEQCSYTTAPKQKKFSYVKEKKFNSNDPLVEEKTIEQIDDQPTVEKVTLSLKDAPEKEKYSASASQPKQKKLNEEIYEIPERYTSSNKDKFDSFNLDHYKTLENEKTERVKAEKDRVQEHDDYLKKLFPEYAEKEQRNQETKQSEKTEVPGYFTPEESKKDVDSVLEEFAKKDRSKCKKISKNKMTCYLCVDNKGIQHEECMFVSESQPKSSHIAYHEVKQFKSNPEKKQETADSKQAPKVVAAASETVKNKQKAQLKKPVAVSIKDVDAEPTEVISVNGAKTPRVARRRTNLSKEYAGLQGAESKREEVRVESPAAEEEKEPELPTPAEVKEGSDGAYASELKPVFSKKLGVTLPAYMLEISEGEKIFDEAVRSGR